MASDIVWSRVAKKGNYLARWKWLKYQDMAGQLDPTSKLLEGAYPTMKFKTTFCG
jgi:hypothetical protein